MPRQLYYKLTLFFFFVSLFSLLTLLSIKIVAAVVEFAFISAHIHTHIAYEEEETTRMMMMMMMMTTTAMKKKRILYT